jgi:hypothetical protein
VRPLPLQVDIPEAQDVQQTIMNLILGFDPYRTRVWLPGSQPVSLDSTNLKLLKELNYWCVEGWWGCPRILRMQPSVLRCHYVQSMMLQS